jgi:hypothetical protein
MRGPNLDVQVRDGAICDVVKHDEIVGSRSLVSSCKEEDRRKNSLGDTSIVTLAIPVSLSISVNGMSDNTCDRNVCALDLNGIERGVSVVPKCL